MGVFPQPLQTHQRAQTLFRRFSIAANMQIVLFLVWLVRS